MSTLKERAFDAVSRRCKERQKSKFDTSLTNRYAHNGDKSQCDAAMKNRWVVNLSDTPPDQAETEVLRKGLNFAPAPMRIPTTQLMASVEKGISRLLMLMDDANAARK